MMNRASRIGSFSVVLAFVISLSGCAFGTRQATLIYPPRSEADVTPVVHATVEATPKNVPIILMPFNDRRRDKSFVGAVQNGFGMHTADVVPVNSVSEWVSQAIQTDLQNSGYNVIIEKPGDSAPGQTATVSGDIVNVFCEAYFTYEGEVSFTARVNRDGKELLSRQYVGRGSAGLNWAATAEGYAQSLALALSSAIKQLISDLDKILPAQ